MPDTPIHTVSGWVLSGGEGRRMGGQDKGLLHWQGQPMAWQTAQRLAAQVQGLCINANRNLQTYGQWPWPVIPDDADLPATGGPTVGLLTGLRQAQSQWLQLAPCDNPSLPADLVSRLLGAATASHAQVAVPVTLSQDAPGLLHHHWTSALVATCLLPDLERYLQGDERRLGKWLTRQRWAGVLFEQFANVNTPEALGSLSPR